MRLPALLVTSLYRAAGGKAPEPVAASFPALACVGNPLTNEPLAGEFVRQVLDDPRHARQSLGPDHTLVTIKTPGLPGTTDRQFVIMRSIAAAVGDGGVVIATRWEVEGAGGDVSFQIMGLPGPTTGGMLQ